MGTGSLAGCAEGAGDVVCGTAAWSELEGARGRRVQSALV